MKHPAYQELPPEVFENAPLYAKVPWLAEKSTSHITAPAVHLYCSHCHTDRTFERARIHNNANVESGRAAGESIAVWYQCAYCGVSKYTFLVRVTEDSKHLMKVGQYPPPDLSVGKHLRRVLGDCEELYKKGLTCERFGYGIAAFAYFRRVVELIIDKLLAIVEEILSPEDRTAFESALKKVRSSHVAEEKIKLVKDMIPGSLRPDGINPLGVLYEALSEGLHDRTDEECLIYASQVRSAMVLFIEKVENEKLITRQFTDAMRNLLERKNTRPA
jgi:hypothetical protein